MYDKCKTLLLGDMRFGNHYIYNFFFLISSLVYFVLIPFQTSGRLKLLLAAANGAIFFLVNPRKLH